MKAIVVTLDDTRLGLDLRADEHGSAARMRRAPVAISWRVSWPWIPLLPLRLASWPFPTAGLSINWPTTAA